MIDVFGGTEAPCTLAAERANLLSPLPPPQHPTCQKLRYEIPSVGVVEHNNGPLKKTSRRSLLAGLRVSRTRQYQQPVSQTISNRDWTQCGGNTRRLKTLLDTELGGQTLRLHFAI